MKVYRCFAWNERAKASDPDGPLWCPRTLQGEGRHDNPDLFGCVYVSERPVSAVVEQLARFRGQVLVPSLLRRRGLPLALADLERQDPAGFLDLDDPIVLRRAGLRPSRVATRQRVMTQPQARALYEQHADATGLRWWSTYEALWMNVTIFDRDVAAWRIESVRPLAIDDPVVLEAAEFLGLRGAA